MDPALIIGVPESKWRQDYESVERNFRAVTMGDTLPWLPAPHVKLTSVQGKSTDDSDVAAPKVLSILSLEIADRCELQLSMIMDGAVLVSLTDRSQRFAGQMGDTKPLWDVLNGGKAAARGTGVLLGLAREGGEIDVIAYQHGRGVQLATRFAAASFADMLERLELPLRATMAEAHSGRPRTSA